MRRTASTSTRRLRSSAPASRDCDLPGTRATGPAVSSETNKLLVRRLVDEAVAKRNPDVLDELASGEFAQTAKRWVSPFASAFPDFEMEIVDLIAEGEAVVAHFRCSGTHRGEWLGVAPTGRRFEGVDEIYIFWVGDGKLVSAIGVEDNLARMRQLGITPGG
jgi:predicted ester cyclase